MNSRDIQGFKTSIECSNSYNKCFGTVLLKECNDDPSFHLKQINLANNNSKNPTEQVIILSRLGIDPSNLSHRDLSICIKHRKLLGLHCHFSSKCCNPDHNDSQSCKKRINYEKALLIIRLVDLQLIPPKYKQYIFGSSICIECYAELDKLLSDKYDIILKLSKFINITKTITWTIFLYLTIRFFTVASLKLFKKHFE
jgi:hypothetical protein